MPNSDYSHPFYGDYSERRYAPVSCCLLNYEHFLPLRDFYAFCSHNLTADSHRRAITCRQQCACCHPMAAVYYSISTYQAIVARHVAKLVAAAVTLISATTGGTKANICSHLSADKWTAATCGIYARDTHCGNMLRLSPLKCPSFACVLINIFIDSVRPYSAPLVTNLYVAVFLI